MKATSSAPVRHGLKHDALPLLGVHARRRVLLHQGQERVGEEVRAGRRALLPAVLKVLRLLDPDLREGAVVDWELVLTQF